MSASSVHAEVSIREWVRQHVPWGTHPAHGAHRASLGRGAARRRFVANRDRNLFLGVYDSFEAASADAPPEVALGYDNDASAELYVPRVYPYDYPALFWLSRAFADGMRSVFDLGGHVGLKYFAFRRLMPYPANLRWTVCDVPAVVDRGRALAEARQVTDHLAFTTDVGLAGHHDVLYASGSLQYLPRRIGDILGTLARRPRRIVLNITAVHPSRTFITLNSIGTAVCPYRVQARDELVTEITAHGYVRRDEWENPGKQLDLPFEPALCLDHYTGFCFELP